MMSRETSGQAKRLSQNGLIAELVSLLKKVISQWGVEHPKILLSDSERVFLNSTQHPLAELIKVLVDYFQQQRSWPYRVQDIEVLNDLLKKHDGHKEFQFIFGLCLINVPIHLNQTNQASPLHQFLLWTDTNKDYFSDQDRHEILTFFDEFFEMAKAQLGKKKPERKVPFSPNEQDQNDWRAEFLTSLDHSMQKQKIDFNKIHSSFCRDPLLYNLVLDHHHLSYVFKLMLRRVLKKSQLESQSVSDFEKIMAMNFPLISWGLYEKNPINLLGGQEFRKRWPQLSFEECPHLWKEFIGKLSESPALFKGDRLHHHLLLLKIYRYSEKNMKKMVEQMERILLFLRDVDSSGKIKEKIYQFYSEGIFQLDPFAPEHLELSEKLYNIVIKEGEHGNFLLCYSLLLVAFKEKKGEISQKIKRELKKGKEWDNFRASLFIKYLWVFKSSTLLMRSLKKSFYDQAYAYSDQQKEQILEEFTRYYFYTIQGQNQLDQSFLILFYKVFLHSQEAEFTRPHMVSAFHWMVRGYLTKTSCLNQLQSGEIQATVKNIISMNHFFRTHSKIKAKENASFFSSFSLKSLLYFWDDLCREVKPGLGDIPDPENLLVFIQSFSNEAPILFKQIEKKIFFGVQLSLKKNFELPVQDPSDNYEVWENLFDVLKDLTSNAGKKFALVQELRGTLTLLKMRPTGVSKSHELNQQFKDVAAIFKKEEQLDLWSLSEGGWEGEEDGLPKSQRSFENEIFFQ